MTASTRKADVLPGLLATVAIGVAAFAAVGVASRFGTGISTDSVAYLAQAHHLADGRGITMPAGLLEIYDEVDPGRSTVPAAHFPPLYPALLAVTGLAGDGSLVRWLNAVLLAVSALVVAAMVRRYTGSRAAGTVAAGMVAWAPAVLRVHAMAWSEPLFVAMGLTGLLALAVFCDGGRRPVLVAAGLLCGATWLTRYAGVAFVLTGVVVLLRLRPRAAGAFVVLAAAPMALFRLATAGAADGYTLVLHPPSSEVLDKGREALGNWLVPLPFSPAIRLAGLGAIVLTVYLLLRLHRPSPPPGPGRRLARLPMVLATFLVLYVAVVLASLVAFAESASIEERFFVPAYAVAVPLVACLLTRLNAGPPPLRAAVLLPVAALVGSTALAGATALRLGTRDYPGFAAPEWRHSGALREIDALPASTRVWSNFPEAVYLATGRPARLLPRRVLPGDRPPRHASAALAGLVEQVRRGDGVVVLFTLADRPQVVGRAELAPALGSAPPTVLLDALVFRAPPAG